MKKIISLFLLLLAAGGVTAQVNYTEDSLIESIAKAKKENKMVVLFCCSSWCGPCKELDKNFFPTKEAGDYFNPRFIVLKRDLDKSDPDGINGKYDIRAYPTFVFINGDGEEVIRMVGAGANFMERIIEATAPKNTHIEREKRFLNDDSYAMEHLKFLNDNRLYSKIDPTLIAILERRSVEENFKAENLNYFREIVTEIASPVVQFMLKNRDEVVKVTGETKYNEFLTSKINTQVSKVFFNRSTKAEVLASIVESIEKYKPLQTAYCQFVLEANNAIKEKNVEQIVTCANRYITNADTESRQRIFATVKESSFPRTNKEAFLKFLERCAKEEQNPRMRRAYEMQLEELKQGE